MTSPYYSDNLVTLHHGDCRSALALLPDASVDAVVTDPPYELGFMGKGWDSTGVAYDVDLWRECLRVLKPGGHLLSFGGTRTFHRMAVAVEDAGFEIRDSIAWMYGSGFPKHRAALKPAFEPIVVARKPFKGSLTANEAEHGTGAFDIDGCRIGTEARTMTVPPGFGPNFMDDGWVPPASGYEKTYSGRWPANVMLDEGAADELGEASRFFYVSKASKGERPTVDGVAHPTVKPLALMRYLVKLVTPAGGTVLEPFAGSGATVEACILEGYKCIAIELEESHMPLIMQRIAKPMQQSLFGDFGDVA